MQTEGYSNHFVCLLFAGITKNIGGSNDPLANFKLYVEEANNKAVFM